MDDKTLERRVAEQRVARYLELAAEHRGFFNEHPAEADGLGNLDPEDLALADGLVATAFSSDADPGDEQPDPAEAEAQAVPAQGWSPSEEEWRQVTGVIGQLGYLLQQAQAEQAQQQGLQQQPQFPEYFDPSDPEQLAVVLQQQQQQTVEQVLGALSPILAPMQQQQSQSLVDGWLQQAEAELQPNMAAGVDFDRDATAYVSHGMLAGFRAQGLDNPQLAVRRAAEYMVEHDKKVAAAAVEQFKQELRSVSAAPTQAGPGASAAAEIIPFNPGDDEVAVARRLASAATLT